MDSRRDFLKKSLLSSGALGISHFVPASIKKALDIDPAPGSTFVDAEHIVILMQENRSFDHAYGSLKGVRGFNDPRAIKLPNGNPVWCQTDINGKTFAPFRLDIKDSKITWMGSLPHSRSSQVDALNEGRMDKWLIAKRSGNAQYREMPLTLGHYTREDLPFHYALADAFTVCDHNFCSGITSTTPNRSYFWTGNILSEENGLTKANIRNDDYKAGKHKWKTFPELLEQNGISWRFYQNDLSTGGGFVGEERAWLANFGCNLLEFFEKYNVKFNKRYVESLQKQMDTLPEQIQRLQEKLATSNESDEKNDKMRNDMLKKQSVLDNATKEYAQWNKKNYDQLNPQQKSLFERAFTINNGDKHFHDLDKLKYEDKGEKREIVVPKGDLLYQFRKDVKDGKLPTVSWLAGPQNLSDHPSAPWYGAWYVSEIIDILTQNPEVWKKTIFIMTYDENDGYFDHVPSFLAPDALRPETGKCSEGIDTSIEWVRKENEIKQGIREKEAREAPIGLGFRVPMVIASPWSRGGQVCSQIFDHTSTLQFLETFIQKKYSKNVHIDNISEWRRTVCGDLTAAFQPYNPQDKKLPFLDRNQFIQTIYNAQFKSAPTGFSELSTEDVALIATHPQKSSKISQQEPGISVSTSIPYELYADAKLSADKKNLILTMKAGKDFFGSNAAGAPFMVYAGNAYKDVKQDAFEIGKVWSYAVRAGHILEDQYEMERFKDAKYHINVVGPNGFLREIKGSQHDGDLSVETSYEKAKLNNKATGNIRITLKNNGSTTMAVNILDNAYNNPPLSYNLKEGEVKEIVLNLQKHYGWYDFSVTGKNEEDFLRRFAGHVETEKASMTDPFMGRMV
ncbi:MAG: phospholipase C, phosphocholine-specific [Pseudopedobacter saltans]|uniref:phospholipase C n=1 Tax=Pseudopedobacter saltans TaxID=151895 RepID=A0A2W5HFR2_9SPHI|nr:MAG: phospholipase C, phosphocholine-specific [Pseudopedobacter saltans]